MKTQSSEIDLTFTTLMGDQVEPQTRVYRREREICKESGYIVHETGGKSVEDTIFDKVHEVDLKKTMETSYIDYAMSVIRSPCTSGCKRRTEAGTAPYALFHD